MNRTWLWIGLGVLVFGLGRRTNPYRVEAMRRACAILAGQAVTDDSIPERDRLVAWYLAHPDRLDCARVRT